MMLFDSRELAGRLVGRRCCLAAPDMPNAPARLIELLLNTKVQISECQRRRFAIMSIMKSA